MTASSFLPDWRDRTAYDAIPALGRGALAWEVLRRDPEYQRFAKTYAQAVEMPPRGVNAAGDWGLHFP